MYDLPVDLRRPCHGVVTMSLINQVLKDLEKRQANEMADATQNMEGLAPTTPVQRKSGKLIPVLVSFVIVLSAGLSGAWWWHQHNRTEQKTIAMKSATKPAPTLAAAPAKAPVVAPVSHKKAVPVHEPRISHNAHVVHRPAKRHKQEIARTHARQTRPTGARHSKHVTTSTPDAREAGGQMQKQMVPFQKDQKAEIAYQAAYDQIELHNLARAETLLRRALSYDPANIRSRILLAGLMIKQGRWVETVGLMQQGLKQRPDNTDFLKLYARVLMQLDRDHEAIQVLREHAPGIAADPNYYALLAALDQRQHDHRDAAKIYANILKLRPDTGAWWVGLGISLEALGKTKQAQEAYARARKTGSLVGELARFTDKRLVALDAINYPMH